MADLDYDSRRKAELISELDAARRDIRAFGAGVRRGADVSARVKQSFHGHKAGWIAGAVVGGLILAFLLRPRRKVKVLRTRHEGEDAGAKVVRAGILLTVGKFAFSVLEPILKNALRKYVASRFVRTKEDDLDFGF